MRVEFVVSGRDRRWTVQRGHTRALSYESCEAAIRAAENLAEAVIRRGDLALVTLLREGCAAESRLFRPERRTSLALIRG